MGPIIDVFDQEGVRFGLEVHPTEIAYDFITTRRALEAIAHRPGFGINFDPSHLIPQFLDPAAFLTGAAVSAGLRARIAPCSSKGRAFSAVRL